MQAFIWDLDGTLLNSYGVIVSGLYDALRESGVEITREEIHRGAIRSSVRDLLEELHKTRGFDLQRVSERNRELAHARLLEVEPEPHALETLKKLNALGCDNYVYTHKGVTTEPILRHLGMADAFRETVTSLNGFPRKPEPHALTYLVEKYSLDPKETYYVGDRKIDVECACAAGIRSILYCPPGSYTEPTGREDAVVQDLLEIPELVKK